MFLRIVSSSSACTKEGSTPGFSQHTGHYARPIELAGSDFNREHLEEFVKRIFGPVFELTE
jgi:hypothetical protein